MTPAVVLGVPDMYTAESPLPGRTGRGTVRACTFGVGMRAQALEERRDLSSPRDSAVLCVARDVRASLPGWGRHCPCRVERVLLQGVTAAWERLGQVSATFPGPSGVQPWAGSVGRHVVCGKSRGGWDVPAPGQQEGENVGGDPRG